MKLSHIIKSVSPILAAAALLIFTAACSNDGGAQKNVDYGTLSGAVNDAVAGFDSAEYTPREESYIKNFIKITPADCANCSILVSTEGGSINEYGIIEAGEGQSASDISDVIKAYFDFYRGIWDDRYLAEEYPKLRDAEVRVFADKYVVYTIMGESERSAVYSAVDALFN